MSDGRNDKVYLGFEKAVALLPDGDHIHTFVNPAASLLVGADWKREHVIRALRTGEPQLAGEAATAMGHGIVVVDEGRYVFIATKPAKSEGTAEAKS